MIHLRLDLESRGFAVVEDLLGDEEVDSLLVALSRVDGSDGVRKRSGVYAIRNLLDAVPEVARLAASDKMRALVRAALGKDATPVRGTLFDKTADANWLVPWHQDLTICVKRRVDVDGYGPWTVKAGVPHVQPPESVLKKMLAVRIHLDDCYERNGALRVLPGTHRAGRLTAEQIEEAKLGARPVVCEVGRGGAVLMKPLILHSSSAADEPSHRRVVHIDYAACKLPLGLDWFASDMAAPRNM